MSTIRLSDVRAFGLGLLYLLITFCLGRYLGSLLVGIVFCVAISFALIKLSGPPGTVSWRTAIAFSVPSFLAGLLALHTFTAFAVAGFLGSFASRARGAKQTTPHGPLQRLLERMTTVRPR